MPEISDDEYKALQAAYQTASFAESLYNDPALGPEVKRIIKRKYPNLEIPGYDAKAYVDEQLTKDRTEREEAERRKREAEDERAWRERRAETQKAYGFTDEAMADLEKFMIEKNVGDYEVAASYQASRQPSTTAPTYDDHLWNHAKAEGFAEIAKDPEAWGRSEIMKAIAADQQRERGRF